MDFRNKEISGGILNGLEQFEISYINWVPFQNKVHINQTKKI